MRHWLKIMTMACMVAALIACGKTAEQQIAEQMDLGERYLEEMKYEEAVVAFQKVIELDDRNVEAYLGLSQAYEALGDTEQALAVLETGYEKTQDPRVQERLDQLKEMMGIDGSGGNPGFGAGGGSDGQEGPGSESGAHGEPDSGDMQESEEETDSGSSAADVGQSGGGAGVSPENREFLMDLVEDLEDLINEEGDDSEDGEDVYDRLKDRESQLRPDMDGENPVIVMVDDEKGVGVYRVGVATLMIYYGDYVDGRRHGRGVWMGNWSSAKYRAVGQWADDAPNGEQEETVIMDVETQVLKGQVTDGSWQGPVRLTIKDTMFSGHTYEFEGSMTDSRWDPIKADIWPDLTVIAEDLTDLPIFVPGTQGVPDPYGVYKMNVTEYDSSLDYQRGIVGFADSKRAANIYNYGMAGN